MKQALGAGVAAVFAVSCGLSTTAAPSPSSMPPTPATVAAITPYFGSYTTTDTDTVVVARMAWFYDLRDGTYRTIYATASPSRFTIGDAFEQPLPKFADLVFTTGGLKIVEKTRMRTARHVDYRQSDVTIPAVGAQLAATITEPPTAGPHPGIVIIHGAERGERYIYDVWVGLYASLGLDVLTYDKRGVGASTGDYPGDFPTGEALGIYADDAAAALQFLAKWPGVDGKRVGYHGGSQGGWTVPLAMQRHSGAAFAILVSAPATTVDQTDLWASFTDGGATPATEPFDQVLAQVRGTHSGYDPLPAVRALDQPALWVLGTNDRTVPTAICIEILSSLHKPNFTILTLPTGHGLLLNATGMLADDARSPGLPPTLAPSIGDWLARTLGQTTQ